MSVLRKQALVIQGGAMRSMYCLGAVRSLMEEDKLRGVRRVNVSSAGCVAGLFFLASLGDLGRYEEMGAELERRVANKRFINTSRIRCVVDVDYLVASMLEVAPGAIDALRSSEIVFEISLTDANGEPSYINIASGLSEAEVREALVATMAIPLFYTRDSRVGNERFFDGGISDPLSVVRALGDAEVEEVWAIASVAPGLLGREASSREAAVLKFIPGLPDGIRYAMLGKNALGATTDAILANGLFRGVSLHRVAPRVGVEMGSRLDTALDHLRRLDEMGYVDAKSAVRSMTESAS